MWVISGREAPRPRNTTSSPYPALCKAGSRDGQFGGNALGRACSLTCRSNRRNHTAGTSEALAMSLQAPRTLRTLLMRDRCQLERDAHGNTVWSEIARSTPAARRYWWSSWEFPLQGSWVRQRFLPVHWSSHECPLERPPTGTLRKLTRLRLYDLLHQLAYGKQNPYPEVPERPGQASTVRIGRTNSVGKRRLFRERRVGSRLSMSVIRDAVTLWCPR